MLAPWSLIAAVNYRLQITSPLLFNDFISSLFTVFFSSTMNDWSFLYAQTTLPVPESLGFLNGGPLGSFNDLVLHPTSHAFMLLVIPWTLSLLITATPP